MIKCDICESPLQMDADKSGATCTGCGMKYTIEQVRQMLNLKPASEPKFHDSVNQVEEPIKVTEWKEYTEMDDSHQEEPVEVEDWKEKSFVKPVDLKENSSGTSKKKINIPIHLYVLAFVGILITSLGGFFPMLIGDIIVIATLLLFVNEIRKKKQ